MQAPVSDLSKAIRQAAAKLGSHNTAKNVTYLEFLFHRHPEAFQQLMRKIEKLYGEATDD